MVGGWDPTRRQKELYHPLSLLGIASVMAWHTHLMNPGFLLQTPTIPYLGIFLTDLIMLDTALPDFVEVSIFERGLKEGEGECGEHLVKGQTIVPTTLEWAFQINLFI